MIESFHVDAVETQLGALDALSIDITLYALSTGAAIFPNVTVPYFELKGSNTRALAGALMCWWALLIHRRDKVGMGGIFHS
jgi:hypothetical protein